MNVAVWIVSGVLAVIFLLAGVMKLAVPKPKLVAGSQKWAKDFPPGLIKFIGACEVLGAVGLILPGLLGVATWLVPAAAIGLALMMVGAALTHLRLKEYPLIAANLVLLAAAVFVAFERLGPYAL